MSVNRNIWVLILSAGFFMLSCSQSEPNCTLIKRGHFYYFSKILRDKVLVERNDSMQSESRGGKVVSKSKILWKSNCSYEMYVNLLNDNLSKDDSIFASIPIKVEIVSITKGFYVCKSSMKRADLSIEMKDTIYFDK